MFKYDLLSDAKEREGKKTEGEKRPRTKAKGKINEQPAEKKEEKKLSLDEKLKLSAKILRELNPPFKKFLKGVKIRNLKLEILAAGQDPFEAAKNYAALSCTVYALLGVLDSLFDFKAESVYVYPDFNEQKNRYYIEGSIRANLFQITVLFIRIMKKSGRDIMKLI